MCYPNYKYTPIGLNISRQEILRDKEVKILLQQIETANDFIITKHDLSLKYIEKLDKRISEIKAKYNN